jgi:hypothetical protein
VPYDKPRITWWSLKPGNSTCGVKPDRPDAIAFFGYDNVTMPLQNCWPLAASTLYLRTNASVPSPAIR